MISGDSVRGRENLERGIAIKLQRGKLKILRVSRLETPNAPKLYIIAFSVCVCVPQYISYLYLFHEHPFRSGKFRSITGRLLCRRVDENVARKFGLIALYRAALHARTRASIDSLGACTGGVAKFSSRLRRRYRYRESSSAEIQATGESCLHRRPP